MDFFAAGYVTNAGIKLGIVAKLPVRVLLSPVLVKIVVVVGDLAAVWAEELLTSVVRSIALRVWPEVASSDG